MRIRITAFLLVALCFSSALSQSNTSSIEEKEAIEASNGLAIRDGRQLVLTLSNGNTITLENSENCMKPETCIIYDYKGTIADQQFFVLKAGFWESEEHRLLSRKSGKVYTVNGSPHLSPDGSLIASPFASESYGKNGIFLWKIENGELKNIFSYEPAEYALYEFLKWVDADTIALTKLTHTLIIDCPNTMALIPVKLIKKNGLWALEENATAEQIQCYHP